ncbi:MAG: hypothetical protein HWD83_10935 [Gammaproteobacteria bacterium]|nr:hypothetical protein [Gammaproteobacteria bacterium]
MKKLIRKYKTPVLGIVACAVMIWGVARIWNVPTETFTELLPALTGFLFLIVAASILTAMIIQWILRWIRSRKQ